ncbi:hypothetical protein H0X10_04130 [Candidatus Saccharibacteria bacterium]|nr:hypothetical protein [Candidatus Saccharibacteria bacterium]
MTDKLSDLMGNRDFGEPQEVRTIKEFVRKRFNADVSVAIQQRQIIISVAGASLAGALRMQLHELKKLCATEKRLIIRIQ